MALVVTISDLHLGQSFALGPFKDFLQDLRKRQRPDALILGGDTIELAWFSWPELEAQALFRDSLDELRDFATSFETRLIPGNHDPLAKLRQRDLSPIKIEPLPSIEWDGVIYTHGHQFDVTTHLWDTLLKIPARRLFPRLYVKLYGTPYEVKMAQREKDYREYIGWILGRAMMDVLAKGKDLVYGHTHAPMRVEMRDRTVVNAGDWQDSLSWVEARDGKLSLHFWGP